MRAFGIDRRTSDLDIWVARDNANARAIIRYARDAQVSPPLELLQKPNFKFTIGDPARPEVDMLTSVAGDPPFEDAYARRERLMLDGRRLPVISVADLIEIKTASAEQMESDAANLTLTEEIRKQSAFTAVRERHDITLLNR